MSEYTLHCFAQSGNCYKAALMLELAGADWTPRYVDYFKGEFVKGANAGVLAEFRKRAEGAWSVLNAHLDGRSHVVGERLTYADLSLCGYLFFDDEIGVHWNDYPNIRDWLARIRDEPRWRHPYELMPGHPLPAAAD